MDELKKNILDLTYSKYLQYFTATIIAVFTYFIGLSITIFSKQIDLANISQSLAVAVVSVLFLWGAAFFLLRFKSRMNNVLSELRNL